MYFEIYKESNKITGLLNIASLTNGQWRWRLRAGNNKVISSGEAYHNKADCLHAISLLQDTNATTPIQEID